MENFKFDLTNEQVLFLYGILEDAYTYECHRVYVTRELKCRSELFDSRFIALSTLFDEFNIQSSKYLEDNNLKSFSDGNQSILNMKSDKPCFVVR